jgi:hypothetical protein
MLVHDDGNLVDLLIFGNKKDKAICFNVLANIERNIISGCIKKLFKEFPAIKKVMIDASLNSYKFKNSFLIKKSEDYVLDLPANIDDYYQILGTSTRRKLKYRKNKLLKSFTTVNYFTKFNSDIEESIIDKIVQLNFERMKFKGVIPGIDHRHINKIYKYSQHYGCVTFLELDGKIVAGCIATIINKDVFLHVYAHDNNFSKYNIGESCVFHLIKTSIEKELSTFHFLWGRNELKIRLHAKPHLLFTSFVYRTYSFNYFANKSKMFFLSILKQIKLIGIFCPLRASVKFFRKLYTKEY